jgi:putative ABC transport system permease protein
LGADRWQIARAVIAEAMLVSVAGGALGLGLAALGVRALAAAGPRDVPRLAELAVDGRVVAFTALVSVVAGLLFAVAPALHAARGALSETLRQGGRGSVGARQVARTVLVGAQAALSLILLVGAGLMLKSFWRLQQVDPGFRAEGVLTARVGAPGARYPSPEQARQLLTQLVERARAVPGVRAAGGTTSLPLGGFVQATGIEFAGRPKAAPGEGPSAQVAAVSGEYFRAMGIPVLRGTAFTGAERAGGPTQVIVNQALAAKYFANEDPIGRRIIMEWGDTLDATIVGVVGDTRQTGLDSIPEPVTYWSLAQLLPSTRVTIVARYAGVDAASVAAGFRAAVKEVDPLLPIADVKTLDAYLSESVAQRRLNTVLLGAFAAAALLLAAVGVYGVVAYAVAQRTREIGLRVALGATRGGVMRLVVGQGLRVVGAGAAVGVLGAFALTRVLASQLYGVSPTDVPTFVGVPLLLVAVAAAASAAPARRAARVDPQTALREE